MVDKLREYVAIANQVILYLPKDIDSWCLFLRVVGNIHKYPFIDQLMIFAQMPPAAIPTAIAEKELWEKGLHRRIKPQAQGITLFIIQDGKPVGLRTVYDMADTEGPDDVRLWGYGEQYRESVCGHLAERYGVPRDKNITEILVRTALKLTDDYWEAHKRNIMGATRDSLLEELDEQNTGVWFRQSMAASLENDRDMAGYAIEELIAECGAALLLYLYSVSDEATTHNSAAYIRGWLRQLSAPTEMLNTAMDTARAAVDRIINGSDPAVKPC